MAMLTAWSPCGPSPGIGRLSRMPVGYCTNETIVNREREAQLCPGDSHLFG